MTIERSPSSRAIHRGLEAIASLRTLKNVETSPSIPTNHPPKLPKTSAARLLSEKPETILYLAYGSNLSAQTFKGTRGIKPLSSLNVQVPTLALTFDLAGIPYVEPCFANTRYRDATSPSTPITSDYHKDRWHKGLIGVVYEVTAEDYRTIIATEGGGASYQDIIVPCYVLPEGSMIVDPKPQGQSFQAHTLLQPRSEQSSTTTTIQRGRIQRPDPSYAQASARYLKLITDGAEEHNLPSEYLAYLYNLRPYTITTYSQRVGQALFILFWGPIIMSIFSLNKIFADENGKIPPWLVTLSGLMFGAVWASYDGVFKKIFGDGERTMEEKKGKNGDEEHGFGWLGCEKSVRLEDHHIGKS